ncbi:hypothetical protein, partial [Pectobacterium odoriferum]|uniref:hypothetical protein n=1 Tax=Pectobacterium odoriferum TaxID=78398 RepID=UPI003D9A64A3
AGIFRFMTDIPYPVFFLRTQPIKRHGSYRLSSPVTGKALPASPGTQADVDFTAGNGKSRSRGYRFIYPENKLLSLTFRCQSSPSASP